MSIRLSNWDNREARDMEMMSGDAYEYEEGYISARAFNLIMGGIVVYGLIINYILCVTVGPQIYDSVNPIVFLILYIVLCISGTMIAVKSDNPFLSFLGYNMVVLPVGIIVSVCVESYGGVSSAVVSGAFFCTIQITVFMVFLASTFPRIFAKIGGALLFALCSLLLAGFVTSFFGFNIPYYSYIAAAIFSLYIGFDYYRAQQCAPTIDNAVDCALDIYLDIINLFLRLLEIWGNRKDD